MSSQPQCYKTDHNHSQISPKGRFISFEGTEGVGKSTAIKSLVAHLEDCGIEYIQTREPGGSPLSEKIRDFILNPSTVIDDDTELLMVFSGRSDHINQVIKPALNSGKWVICDRFYDSSIAYQGFGRAGGTKEVLNKIDTLISLFVRETPELTLWLDMPILEGMIRAGKRSEADRFEVQGNEFFERVYKGFQRQADKNPERFERIDARGSQSEVADRIWDIVRLRMGITQ